MAMVLFDRVSKRYGGTGSHDALSNVSFALEKGEMAFLTGHSGAGKSTLLKLMMLMEQPTRGQVVINHQDLAALSRRQVPFHRRQIGVVFQNHQLLFDRTVHENVALPMQIAGYAPLDYSRRVKAALDSVGLLHLEHRNPIELSGGEQQRVGIARAVVNKPPLLLADEPTGNLDPELSAEIMKLFTLFQHSGTTVLIATHDIDLVKRMGKRRLILDHGRLSEKHHGG